MTEKEKVNRPLADDFPSERRKYVSWMKTLYDDKSCHFRTTKLGDIVIPGSHNAGTKGMSVSPRCQDDDILDQLVAGSRFLDLRVSDNPSFDDAVFFHGPLNSSNKLSDAVYQIKRFLNDVETQKEIIVIQCLIDTEAIWTREKTELADYDVMPDLKPTEKVAELTPEDLIGRKRRLVLVNTAPKVNAADKEAAEKNMVAGGPYGNNSLIWLPYLDRLREFERQPGKLWIWHLGHPDMPWNKVNFRWFTRMFGRDYSDMDPSCPDLREVKLNILNVDFISRDHGEDLNWVHWISNLNRRPKTVEPNQIPNIPYKTFKLKVREPGKKTEWVKLD